MCNAAIILYGIRTCDTCRKALRWLESRRIEHRYHDLRADGIDARTLDRWIGKAGLEAVLNRRGTTWRKLPPGRRKDLTPAAARDLMLSYPTLVKRPVVEAGADLLTIGFGTRQQQLILEAVGTSLAENSTTESAVR